MALKKSLFIRKTNPQSRQQACCLEKGCNA
jgi:hypothetical protein